MLNKFYLFLILSFYQNRFALKLLVFENEKNWKFLPLNKIKIQNFQFLVVTESALPVCKRFLDFIFENWSYFNSLASGPSALMNASIDALNDVVAITQKLHRGVVDKKRYGQLLRPRSPPVVEKKVLPES